MWGLKFKIVLGILLVGGLIASIYFFSNKEVIAHSGGIAQEKLSYSEYAINEEKELSLKTKIENLGFDYVNPEITASHFLENPVTPTKFTLFVSKYYNKYYSDEETIVEMNLAGWRPATLNELLDWVEAGNWDGKSWISALGSTWDKSGKNYIIQMGTNENGKVLTIDYLGGDRFDSQFLAVK